MSWIRSVTRKNREENWVQDLALQDAIARLNPREKHIIELRFFEGRTPDGGGRRNRHLPGPGQPSGKKRSENHAELPGGRVTAPRQEPAVCPAKRRAACSPLSGRLFRLRHACFLPAGLSRSCRPAAFSAQWPVFPFTALSSLSLCWQDTAG